MQPTYTNSTGTYQPTIRYDADNQPYTVNLPVNQSNVISSTSLAPVTNPIQTVPAPTDTTNYAGIIGATADNIANLTKQTNDAQTALNDPNNADSLSNQILSLMGSENNKTADTQAANESTGFNAATQQLNDLNAQAQSLNREAQAAPIIAQQNALPGSTRGGNAPVQADLLRANALKALSLAQQADIAQANYTAAKDKAQQIIDLKYLPIENQIATLKQQYEFNKDALDATDKKRSDALAAYIQQQDQNIADTKAIALEASKNGADQTTIDAISKATDFNSALEAAGTSLATSDNAFQTIKNADGSEKLVLVDKKTGNIIKTISGGSGGGGTDIPTSVIQTIPTPNGAKPVTGYTLQAGDDPYVIAQNNGTDMATLKTLNPTITDWTKLPVGATINLPDTANNWLKGKSDAQVSAFNSLPEIDKDSVQQLVTGNALLSDLVKSRGIQGTAAIQKLINESKSIDPNFSVNTNKLRYNYQQQFNAPNGKEQVQINAINTGLGHLAEFATSAQALGNTKFTDVNALDNYIKSHTGDTNITNFKTVVSALGSELATIYKGGTAPSETEIANWENVLLSNYSSSQMTGVATTTANLISNKMLSLNNTYKNVMGKYPDNQIINPDVINELISSGVDISSITDRLKSQGYDIPNNDNATLTPYGLGVPAINNVLKQFGL
jgi:hypothetical protein